MYFMFNLWWYYISVSTSEWFSSRSPLVYFFVFFQWYSTFLHHFISLLDNSSSIWIVYYHKKQEKKNIDISTNSIHEFFFFLYIYFRISSMRILLWKHNLNIFLQFKYIFYPRLVYSFHPNRSLVFAYIKIHRRKLNKKGRLLSIIYWFCLQSSSILLFILAWNIIIIFKKDNRRMWSYIYLNGLSV